MHLQRLTITMEVMRSGPLLGMLEVLHVRMHSCLVNIRVEWSVLACSSREDSMQPT